MKWVKVRCCTEGQLNIGYLHTLKGTMLNVLNFPGLLIWTQNSYYKLFKPFKNCFWQTRSGIIPFRTAVPAEGTCKHYIVLTSMANYNIRRKLPILSEIVWADSQQVVPPSRSHWVDMTYIGFSHRDRC